MNFPVLTLVLSLFHFTLLSQSIAQDSCFNHPSTYEVRIRKGIFEEQVRSEIIPRPLKKEEECLVANSRGQNNSIIVILDERHEVIIYSHSVIKKD